MRARVTLTTGMFKKLLVGDPLQFKMPQAVQEIEVVLEDGILAKFGNALKVLRGVIDKLS